MRPWSGLGCGANKSLSLIGFDSTWLELRPLRREWNEGSVDSCRWSTELRKWRKRQLQGVATLWGAGLTIYKRAIAWATGFTFLGSLTAVWLGSALAPKFSGAKLVDSAVVSRLPFLTAIVLGAGATVLLAARLGLPISTTHSITGALVGAGVTAAGFSHVRFAALGRASFCLSSSHRSSH